MRSPPPSIAWIRLESSTLVSSEQLLPMGFQEMLGRLSQLNSEEWRRQSMESFPFYKGRPRTRASVRFGFGYVSVGLVFGYWLGVHVGYIESRARRSIANCRGMGC
jgi:hypothetical protein